MSKKKSKKSNVNKIKPTQKETVHSLLDHMKDGEEYCSLLSLKIGKLDLISEMRKAIKDIEKIRKKPTICYLPNVVNHNLNSSIAIDSNDDLPFSEMVSTIPETCKEIDIVLVTPGGIAQQVAKFIDKLRPRFEKVTFILPDICMSAGTIFAMSGDEIIMDSRAYIGPIDPQIPNKNGHYVPAQAILTLIKEIQKRGEANINNGLPPQWTDIKLLDGIDGKDIGNAMNASEYSIDLVQQYLLEYKFKTWLTHSNKTTVTNEEKKAKAKEIAEILCEHDRWKTHNCGINRDVAWEKCKLKIKHPEDIEGLNRSIRRFWALCYWVFDNTAVFKMFISENYCILRNEHIITKKG